MELEITVAVAFILCGYKFSTPSEEEGYASFNEETESVVCSVKDIPFSTSSAIYSACWIEFVLFTRTFIALFRQGSVIVTVGIGTLM